MIEAINCVEDLVIFAREFAAGSTDPVWWRGHADARWRLVPKVFRRGVNYVIEANMALRFMAKARTRHQQCPASDDYAGWLHLMQHYGLPTRLLDWSESPLVAALFAVEDESETIGEIWALRPTRVNRRSHGLLFLAVPEHGQAKELIEDAFTNKLTKRDKVSAMVPHEVDIRMLLQSSMFTIHGSGVPLDELVGDSSDLMHSALIPPDAKSQLREELALMGVQRSTLFPDLENLSQDIATEEWRNARA